MRAIGYRPFLLLPSSDHKCMWKSLIDRPSKSTVWPSLTLHVAVIVYVAVVIVCGCHGFGRHGPTCGRHGLWPSSSFPTQQHILYTPARYVMVTQQDLCIHERITWLWLHINCGLFYCWSPSIYINDWHFSIQKLKCKHPAQYYGLRCSSIQLHVANAWINQL